LCAAVPVPISTARRCSIPESLPWLDGSSAQSADALNTNNLALLALKFAVSDDPVSALGSGRDEDVEPCAWPGVICIDDGGRGELENASLAVYLPSELSLPSELQTLSLPYNHLYDQKHTTLDLAHNLLSGQILVGIGWLLSLSQLNLSSNQLN
jgi:hypothetical protein